MYTISKLGKTFLFVSYYSRYSISVLLNRIFNKLVELSRRTVNYSFHQGQQFIVCRRISVKSVMRSWCVLLLLPSEPFSERVVNWNPTTIADWFKFSSGQNLFDLVLLEYKSSIVNDHVLIKKKNLYRAYCTYYAGHISNRLRV